jgi:5-formyltetrahydrofolate cyclo-ligase
MSVKEEKNQLRARIWRGMTERGIARFPLPCRGRIPNFEGSEEAAEKVRSLEEWKHAKAIVSNPDYAQHKVRENVLRTGKLLIMASPGLRHGYLLVDSESTRNNEKFASTIKGAFKFGKQVREFQKPDIVITGSVAVDKRGNRLGKGHGYGDQEISMIRKKFGKTPVVTTVHDIQVVDSVPSEERDEKINIIVTPTRVIRIKANRI